MIAINLLLTSIYTIINFSYEHNNFELAQKHNYFSYANTNNNFEYNNKFAENLYDNNYIFNETMITVLTHGMGGNLNYWFPKDEANNYSPLYYDEESLPYKILSTMTVDTYNLPIISFEPRINNNEIYNVTLKQLIIDENSEYTFRYLNVDNYEQFEGIFSKHIILIYDGEYVNEFTGESNAFISNIFKKSLDATLATFSPFYGGNLPKINLIGHSRGGILNLYYAAQRKNIVSNLISIGTPYNGTSWGDGLQSLMKISECIKGEERPDFSGILGESNSRINEELLSDLDDVYKVAIGCEVTPDVFCTEIINILTNSNIQSLADLQFGENNFVIRIINKVIEKILSSDIFVKERVRTAIRAVRSLSREFKFDLNSLDFLNDIFNILDIVTIRQNEIDVDELFSICIDFLDKIINLCDEILDFDNNECIKTDFCVDLDSQFCEKNGNHYFDRKILVPFGLENYNFFIDKYLSAPILEDDNTSFVLRAAHNYESIYPSITDNIVNIHRQRQSLHKHFFNNVGHRCSCGFSFDAPLNINPYRIPFYYFDEDTIAQLYQPDMRLYGDEFNLREQYYFESQLYDDEYCYSTTSHFDDVQINVHRLRTGFIRNEKITLSPNRTGAGFAYIELTFSRAIYNLSFDISLWSDDESISTSNLHFVYSTDGSFREYLLNYMYEDYINENQLNNQTLRGQQAILNDQGLFGQYYSEIPVQNLPVDRNDPITYRLNNEHITYIGFYAACNPTTSTKNKGRICISNLTFNFCEL